MIKDKLIKLQRVPTLGGQVIFTTGKNNIPFEGFIGKKIFITGAYDLLHVGHARFLNTAKELGGTLIVGLHSDDFITKRKGEGRPLNNQAKRIELLSCLYFVDCIVIIDSFENLHKTIKAIMPDIFVVSETNNNEKENSPETMKKLYEDVIEIVVLPEQDKIHSTDFIKKLS